MVRFSVPETLRERFPRGCRKACVALSRDLETGSLCYLPQILVAAVGTRSLGPLGCRWRLVRDIQTSVLFSFFVVEEDRTRKP